MFEIPPRYAANTPIEPATFIQKDMKKPEKERIRKSIVEAKLIWQIAGEEIPSFINENYNCSVIMGLDIKLATIKDAAYMTNIVQQMIKAPCVVRFYDHAEKVYSFAHKRLNLTDNTQIVVLDKVLTPSISLVFPDKNAEMLKRYLAFGALVNKRDKLCLYLEAMVKAFVISNAKLYSGMIELLDRKTWYNMVEFIVLYDWLKELLRLNGELKSVKLPIEKVKISGEIKNIMKELKL